MHTVFLKIRHIVRVKYPADIYQRENMYQDDFSYYFVSKIAGKRKFKK